MRGEEVSGLPDPRAFLSAWGRLGLALIVTAAGVGFLASVVMVLGSLKAPELLKAVLATTQPALSFVVTADLKLVAWRLWLWNGIAVTIIYGWLLFGWWWPIGFPDRDILWRLCVRLDRRLRTVNDPRMRWVALNFRIFPYLPSVVMGTVTGLLLSSLMMMGQSPAQAIVPLLVHGVFELPAVLLGSAMTLASYERLCPALESGRWEEARGGLRRFSVSWRRHAAALGGSWSLLLAAAVLESEVTLRVMNWLRP